MNTATEFKNTEHPLAGVNVLVTRPADQAGHLCALIENDGGKAIRYPVIEILPVSDQPSLNTIIEQLDSYDLGIFISANAVNYALLAVRAKREFPQNLCLATIGDATRKALEKENLKASIYPTQKFDSEALLALPQMQQIEGKRIIIFRGKGGRELLKKSLQERGAHVDYAELYQRTMPDYHSNDLNLCWDQNAVDIVTVTSNQALDNLFTIAGKAGRDKLVKTPLVVISQRMVQHATEKGIQAEIMVAERVNDESVLDTLRNWCLAQKQEKLT